MVTLLPSVSLIINPCHPGFWGFVWHWALTEWDKHLNKRWFLPSETNTPATRPPYMWQLKYSLGPCPAFYRAAHPENPIELSCGDRLEILLLLWVNTYSCTAHTIPYRPTLELDINLLPGYPGGLARSWSAITEQRILEAPAVPLRLLSVLNILRMVCYFRIWKIKAHHCFSTLKNIRLEYTFHVPGGFVQETLVQPTWTNIQCLFIVCPPQC